MAVPPGIELQPGTELYRIVDRELQILRFCEDNPPDAMRCEAADGSIRDVARCTQYLTMDEAWQEYMVGCQQQRQRIENEMLRLVVGLTLMDEEIAFANLAMTQEPRPGAHVYRVESGEMHRYTLVQYTRTADKKTVICRVDREGGFPDLIRADWLSPTERKAWQVYLKGIKKRMSRIKPTAPDANVRRASLRQELVRVKGILARYPEEPRNARSSQEVRAAAEDDQDPPA